MPCSWSSSSMFTCSSRRRVPSTPPSFHCVFQGSLFTATLRFFRRLLGVYALGVKEVIGRVPGRWAYVKLRQAEAKLYTSGEEMAEAVEEELEKVAGRSQDIKEPQLHPGPWCRGCPYVRWCPGKREKPLALHLTRGGSGQYEGKAMVYLCSKPAPQNI